MSACNNKRFFTSKGSARMLKDMVAGELEKPYPDYKIINIILLHFIEQSNHLMLDMQEEIRRKRSNPQDALQKKKRRKKE
jgi:hypothetical protein